MRATDATPAAVDGDRVLVGSVGAAAHREALRGAGVTHVVAVGLDLPTPFREDGIEYLRVEIRDDPAEDLLAHLETVLGFMADALAGAPDHRVLVHCFQGKSRSVSVVAAWLMRTHEMSFVEAMDRIRAARPQAAPNLGFAAQLRKFDRLERARREEAKNSEGKKESCSF